MKPKSVIILAGMAMFLLHTCTPRSTNPVVTMETESGKIRVELYPDRAPVSVANFLSYVDQGKYNGASFYRVLRLDNHDNPARIEVIQGGLDLVMNVDSLPPIVHEPTGVTGIFHKDGVISMARYGPGTATSEFFICVGDQPDLDFGGKRNPDGYGFAAFGKVIQGMDVIRNIQQGETTGDFQRLTQPIKILRMIRE